jgi:hypothetical protein
MLALFLKWDFVVVWLCRPGRLRWWDSFAAGATTSSIFVSWFSARATGTATQQLHTFAYNPEFSSLLTGLLVVPAIHLEAAFDENGSSFPQIFASDLGQPSPKYHIDECNLFASLAALSRVNAVDRDAEIADCAAFWGVAYFRIAREVSEEDDFIKTGHSAL